MKYLFIIIAFSTFTLIQCTQKDKPVAKVFKVPYELVPKLYKCDSLVEVVSAEKKIISDSLIVSKKTIDSLKTCLFLANYKIEKVRYYLAICKKNRTQDKFLKGWVTRAIE